VRALDFKRTQLARTLVRGARRARRPHTIVEARRRRSELVRRFLRDRRVLSRYEREVRQSGLMPHLLEAGRAHLAAVEAAGGSYSLGAITYEEGVYLYSILRSLRPRVAVETGVANGFSTAFSLLALEANAEGELHSVDLPREVGKDYDPDAFYAGEGRAGIPPGSEPGWLIPDELKRRWSLVLGRSQDVLPGLLERLGTIDSFMHDSEHSAECMRFEYEQAWPALRDGGVLLSDDVNSTPAFFEFADRAGREPIFIGRGLAFLVKGP